MKSQHIDGSAPFVRSANVTSAFAIGVACIRLGHPAVLKRGHRLPIHNLLVHSHTKKPAFYRMQAFIHSTDQAHPQETPHRHTQRFSPGENVRLTISDDRR